MRYLVMLSSRPSSRPVLLAAAIALAGCHGAGVDGPSTAVRDVTWVDGAMTQPVPAWGSPVRLALPVSLAAIVLGPSGGLGAYGGHQGGHTEGLNHVWIPTVPGTPIRSWADGTVTKIEDMGARAPGSAVHEYFVTIDYGQGLVGKHLDVDQALVAVGARVKLGDPVANGPSAEFMLTDDNRSDGERTGGTGSFVSPFDYLRDADKTALVARFTADVVAPWFSKGLGAGNSRPWEPALTNPMHFHSRQMGTTSGEWILTNKGWRTPDPLYYDLLTMFDVTNSYGHFQRVEAGDHDWSLSGNKNHIAGSWSAPDGPGTIIVTFERGAPLYARYAIDETGSRARLTIEWRTGSYPPTLSAQAAVYVARSPIYLGADAKALGLVP